jgi:hypothetical protein
MKELEVKAMLEDSRIPEQYKLGGRLSSEFLDGVDYAEQRIMEKGVEVWVARDSYGWLSVFPHKPAKFLNYDKDKKYYSWNDPKDFAHIIHLHPDLFPEVTFENSPVKARIILED